MLDTPLPPKNASPGQISEIIRLLKEAPDAENVRVLIARQLAAGVNNLDSEEVFYWAVIHYGVAGGAVEPEVRDVLIRAMDQAVGVKA